MKEKGKIIEIKGDKAVVLMERIERCDKCGLCKKMIERQPVIEAENIINASIGEEVLVEIDEDIFLKISFFLYGMPIIGLIFGAILSSFLKETFFKIFSFILFLLIFWTSGLKIAERYGKGQKPKIVDKNRK